MAKSDGKKSGRLTNGWSIAVGGWSTIAVGGWSIGIPHNQPVIDRGFYNNTPVKKPIKFGVLASSQDSSGQIKPL